MISRTKHPCSATLTTTPVPSDGLSRTTLTRIPGSTLTPTPTVVACPAVAVSPVPARLRSRARAAGGGLLFGVVIQCPDGLFALAGGQCFIPEYAH